ncbi:Mu transposase domain-containing protein [Streptomyces sp. NPDC093064]|uniref:Mu transposase domain-containing protein n=1 Tax=Streptomyces sp. NPDC093064 TaxID=3366020 RepID=UPI0038188210
MFETGRWFTPRVNRFGQVTVRCNSYSVPVRFIGRQLRVLLHAHDLVVYDGRTVVAHHERLSGPGRVPSRPEPLSGGPPAQAGRLSWSDRPRAGQSCREVHAGP